VLHVLVLGERLAVSYPLYSSNPTMSLMPQAQIGVFSGKPSEQEVAAHRHAIEAGGDMRVLGDDPEIRTVPNDGYITGPDAPSVCYLVVFQVGPAESRPER
jgi:hypothetical protein